MLGSEAGGELLEPEDGALEAATFCSLESLGQLVGLDRLGPCRLGAIDFDPEKFIDSLFAI